MKKAITLMVLFLAVITGCNRQRHASKDPDRLAKYLVFQLELNDSQKTSLDHLTAKMKESKLDIGILLKDLSAFHASLSPKQQEELNELFESPWRK